MIYNTNIELTSNTQRFLYPTNFKLSKLRALKEFFSSVERKELAYICLQKAINLVSIMTSAGASQRIVSQLYFYMLGMTFKIRILFGFPLVFLCH